jgi:hypothetical protein
VLTLEALLGFVALSPTFYMFVVLLLNAKPDKGRFGSQALKVSIHINLAANQLINNIHVEFRETKA